MRVYELMTELARMPAAAKVSFKRLATKDECPRYSDEPKMVELDFEIREVSEEIDYNGKPVVCLDGWAE